MNAKETAWLDQEDAWMRDAVRENGWAITYVGNDGCTYPDCECGCEEDVEDTVFGYTVGLHGRGHPELLMYGCDPGTTSLVLNTLGRWIRDGGEPRWGVDHTIDGFAFALQFRPVPYPREILFGAYRFYRPDEADGIAALHVYWQAGDAYPWDADYALPKYVQPLPGEFPPDPDEVDYFGARPASLG